MALLEPIHSPKLTNVHNITLTDARSRYHNLKLDKKVIMPKHHCMSVCMYRFTRLPFGVVPAGDMFEQKVNEIFRDLPNIFGIADDILIVEYDADGRDHDRSLMKVIQICHLGN